MSETLSLQELREAVRDVLAGHVGDGSAIPDEEGRGLDRTLWSEMAQLGWLGLALPDAYGGLGLGAAHRSVLYEEIGRILASVPILPTMLAAQAILRHGGEELKTRALTAIVAGECLATVALPGDARLPSITPEGRISGAVDHVPFGDVATLLLLPVRGAEGTRLAVLPADTPGITVHARPIVDLTRSMARIEMSDVACGDGALLAPGEEGWDALVDHAAAGTACDAVGGAAALLDMTVDYLKIREQFGRPIGSFQALKHRAADWKTELEAITVLARHAAARLDTPERDASTVASEAKAYACDTYAALAGDAVQLHGGIGFTWEHPCHLFLKRAKLSQQLYGDSTYHKERAARLAFGCEPHAQGASPTAPATRPMENVDDRS